MGHLRAPSEPVLSLAHLFNAHATWAYVRCVFSLHVTYSVCMEHEGSADAPG